LNVLVIAGFLGAGKTTLLLRVAHALQTNGEKVVIIENEIGQIGIDQRYIQSQGLEVQEVLGGCICCTLQTSLLDTVSKVRDVLAPSRIIVEPTGAARPGDVVKSLLRAGINRDHIHVVILIDAPRFPIFSSMMEPMLVSQLEAADSVVINKVDEVSAGELQLIAEKLESLSWAGNALQVSAESGEGVDGVLARICGDA
jgi:G3E family GTPase